MGYKNAPSSPTVTATQSLSQPLTAMSITSPGPIRSRPAAIAAAAAHSVKAAARRNTRAENWPHPVPFSRGMRSAKPSLPFSERFSPRCASC
jgi:hypothetical protein